MTACAQVFYIELYTLLIAVVYIAVKGVYTVVDQSVSSSGGQALVDCATTDTSTTRGDVHMALSTECVHSHATLGRWNATAQSFSSAQQQQPLREWEQQPGAGIDWVLTEVQAEGATLQAHERRDCLVASDFVCKRIFGGSGGATTTWCYAEVVPASPDRARAAPAHADQLGIHVTARLYSP